MGDQDKTARRAYEIWEAEGRPEGRDREHWTQAEAESGGFAEDRGDWTGPVGGGIGDLPGETGNQGEGSLEAGADEPQVGIPGDMGGDLAGVDQGEGSLESGADEPQVGVPGDLPGVMGNQGEGTLESGVDEPQARVPGEAAGETEAPLQDGDGAGRPGRGIYAGP